MKVIKEINNLAYDHQPFQTKISVLQLRNYLDGNAIRIISLDIDGEGWKSLASESVLSKKETKKLIGALQTLLSEWEEAEKVDTLEELKRERDEAETSCNNARAVLVGATNRYIEAKHKEKWK